MKGPGLRHASLDRLQVLLKEPPSCFGTGDAGVANHEQLGSAINHGLAFSLVASNLVVLAKANPFLIGNFDDPVNVINSLTQVFAVVLSHRY